MTDRTTKRNRPSLDLNSQILPRSVEQVLLDAEVALGGLDGLVAEGELDLLDGDFALVGELGEGSSNVMGRELEPDFPCPFGDDEVDGLRGERLARQAAGFVDRPEQSSSVIPAAAVQ